MSKIVFIHTNHDAMDAPFRAILPRIGEEVTVQFPNMRAAQCFVVTNIRYDYTVKFSPVIRVFMKLK